MALRFDLGPFEKLFIGKSVITNSHERMLFAVEGTTRILRSKDVLRLELAQSALEKLYHCIQQMYLEEAHEKYRASYLALRAQTVEETPELYPEIVAADALITTGDHYQALKGLKKLVRPDAFSVDRSPSVSYVPRVGGRK